MNDVVTEVLDTAMVAEKEGGGYKGLVFAAVNACDEKLPEIPAEEFSVDEVPGDEVSVNEASIDETSVDEVSVDEVSVDEVSVDEVSGDEVTAAGVSENGVAKFNAGFDTEGKTSKSNCSSFSGLGL